MSDATASGRSRWNAARRTGRGVMAVYRVVWVTIAVAIAALGGVMGAIIVSSTAIVVLSIGGLVLGGGVWMLHPDHTSRRSISPTGLAAGVTAGVLGTVAVVGLSALGGGGAVVLAVAVAVSSPGRVGALARRFGSARVAGADRSNVADGAVRDVRALTDDQLCAAWQQSARALETAHRADLVADIVVARQYFLDEMERRDPVGFSRWLDADALTGHDPSRYLGR